MKGVLASVWHALPLVLVALVVFQILRTCWLEHYVVTSGSMEPLLHGDPVTKVRVMPQKKRGKIVVEYYSLDDLDRIIRLIKK